MLKPKRMWCEPVEGDEAIAIADVIGTAAELRQASLKAVEASKAAEGQPIFGPVAYAARAASGLCGELTGRIYSRARSAGMDGAELLALANDVLDGRKALPAGVETLEAA